MCAKNSKNTFKFVSSTRKTVGRFFLATVYNRRDCAAKTTCWRVAVVCVFQLENADLCDKIHQERQICIAVKVQNRVMQQRNLELSGYGVDEQFFWSTCTQETLQPQSPTVMPMLLHCQLHCVSKTCRFIWHKNSSYKSCSITVTTARLLSDCVVSFSDLIYFVKMKWHFETLYSVAQKATPLCSTACIYWPDWHQICTNQRHFILNITSLLIQINYEVMLRTKLLWLVPNLAPIWLILLKLQAVSVKQSGLVVLSHSVHHISSCDALSNDIQYSCDDFVCAICWSKDLFNWLWFENITFEVQSAA